MGDLVNKYCSVLGGIPPFRLLVPISAYSGLFNLLAERGSTG